MLFQLFLCVYYGQEFSGIVWVEEEKVGARATEQRQNCLLACVCVCVLSSASHVAVNSDRPLMSIPRSVLIMTTSEDSKTLSVDFSSQFAGQVEISTTLSHYRMLTDLVKLFLPANQGGQDYISPRSPSSNVTASESDFTSLKYNRLEESPIPERR